MKIYEHKELTHEQVSYDPNLDRAAPFEDGLDRLARQGWMLITSYLAPVNLSVSTRSLTIFVFRREQG